MSTSEYHDLFWKCQGTGKYHMFCFDRMDSKEKNRKLQQNTQEKMIELMDSIYLSIQEIEKLENKKILVFEEDFVTFASGKRMNGFGHKQEPFVYGDTFGFTIYSGSLDKEIVYKLFEYHKKRMKIDFDFHTRDGYYETNDYTLGNTLYFRGYCMEVLMNYHKPYMQKELEKAKRKL